MVIYIYGFMGNDLLFCLFFVYVYVFFKEVLVEIYVIYIKIYFWYKIYKFIEVVCENFSKWLMFYELFIIDVVLVGYFMGGFLVVDIVLLVSLFIIK